MGIIREYPTSYDRSYKDLKIKAKSQVAQWLDEPVDIVKRCYESIRTQYSKYLRARKDASGCGYDEVPQTGKFGHLQWLKTLIICKTSTTNLKGKYLSNQPSQYSHQNHCVDSLLGKIHEGVHENTTDWNEYEEQLSQGQSINASLQKLNQTSDNEAESTTESTQSVPTGTPKEATAAPSKKACVKTESRKRLEGTELAEDHYYGMSIASCLSSLDRKKETVVISAIEKVFLDI